MRIAMGLLILIFGAVQGCGSAPTAQPSRMAAASNQAAGQTVPPQAVPPQAPPLVAPPAADERRVMPSPGQLGESPCAANFDTFDANGDGRVSFDEYIDGNFARVRFFRAPTEQEIATMKDGMRKDAQAMDLNGDGCLSREEYAATCR